MIIPGLPQHLEPHQILHHSRWLDALLRTNSRAAPSALSRAEQLRTLVACSKEEIEAAEALVRRRYAWRGYEVASATAAATCESPAHSGITLLAQEGERLLGTLTVRPGARGRLLAEATYASEIEGLRSRGRRLGELVKLAVEQGADWRMALDALVQTAYLLTRLVHGLTDVVIEVNPRHARFYQRVFGFVVASAEGFCSRVGAPSVLLLLDLDQFARRLRRSPQKS